MSFASVIGIALVVGTVAVLGIAIVSYMSSLVRNAYEIKVEMRKDLDEGLKQVKADTIKETKAARAELVAEIERTRNNLMEDLKKRQAATEAALAAELKKRDEEWADEREALTSTITELTEQLNGLEGRLTSRTRQKAEQATAEQGEEKNAVNAAPTPTPTPKKPKAPETKPVPLQSFPEEQRVKKI